jgi:hypothetical protein
MSGARHTKDGLLIPAGWLKGLGRDVRIQRGSHVVIIESKQRQSARRRLTQLVKKLRQASQEAGAVDQNEIRAWVDEVRQTRASHR